MFIELRQQVTEADQLVVEPTDAFVNIVLNFNTNVEVNYAGQLTVPDEFIDSLGLGSAQWTNISNTMNVLAATDLFQRQVSIQQNKMGRPVGPDRSQGFREVALSYLVYFYMNERFPLMDSSDDEIVSERELALIEYGLEGMPYMSNKDFQYVAKINAKNKVVHVEALQGSFLPPLKTTA